MTLQLKYPSRYHNKNNILDNKYKIIKELGKGSFSNVFKVEHINTSKYYAIKIIRKINESHLYLLEDSINELNILTTLKDKEYYNITKIYNHFFMGSHMCFVLKLYDISLKLYLKNYGSCSNKVTLSIIKQLLITLDYLQNNKIIHRDIKPDNIVFKDKYRQKIVLIDFSIATHISNILLEQPKKTVQTLYYRAPEIYLNNDYDYRLDIWSIGCITYELLTNSILFKCTSTTDLIILHNNVKLIIDKLTYSKYIIFLKQCLKLNISDRFYAKDLLKLLYKNNIV